MQNRGTETIYWQDDMVLQALFDMPTRLWNAFIQQEAAQDEDLHEEIELDPEPPTIAPPQCELSAREGHCVSQIPQDVDSTPSGDHRKARRNLAAKNRRKQKRIEQKQGPMGYQNPREHLRHRLGSTPAYISFDTDAIPVAKTGYVALDRGIASRKQYRLHELVGEKSKFNFTLVKAQSASVPIVDSQNHVIGIIANHPKDENWADLHKQAAEALESRRSRCHVPVTKRTHRRGRFTTLRCGVSHGGGQRAPGNLKNHADNVKVLEELNALEPFKRFAGFASSVMLTWAKDLYGYYSRTLDKLHTAHPLLRRVFPQSIFSAVSYNFGPHTVCFPHKDFANLAFGWCAITALGTFDYTKGGHLILWELKLVIEFPSGCTILIPSALLTHSNVPVSKDERRYSFAQYTAGGIFRWVENGCQTRDAYVSTLTEAELVDDAKRNENRWMFGLSLLSDSLESQNRPEKGL